MKPTILILYVHSIHIQEDSIKIKYLQLCSTFNKTFLKNLFKILCSQVDYGYVKFTSEFFCFCSPKFIFSNSWSVIEYLYNYFFFSFPLFRS